LVESVFHGGYWGVLSGHIVQEVGRL
jgi:hypothetical protein